MTHILESIYNSAGTQHEEPASIVRNDEQGDLAYSAGQHRYLYQRQLNHTKIGGKIEKMKFNGPGRHFCQIYYSLRSLS